MSHKTRIKMLIVVNPHFPDGTPSIITSIQVSLHTPHGLIGNRRYMDVVVCT